MMKLSIPRITIRLTSLIGKYFGFVLLATFNGVLGFILAMNISIFAGLGIMKYMGIFNGLSFPLIYSIIIISGFLRGGLRYIEQYFNHYLAFKLLAFLRKKIFDKLRVISINRFDEQNKSELVSLIQADVETLEIFYAHTLSPFLIAFITCTIVVVFISIFTNIYIGLLFIFGYLLIGIFIPYIFHLFNKKHGEKYRYNLAKTKSYIIGSVYGKNEIILNNREASAINKVNQWTNILLKDNKKLDFNNVVFKNITLLIIILLNLLVLLIGWILINNNILLNYKLLLVLITFISSFGPVIALANLPYNLSMTFGSAKRIFQLLDEPEINQKFKYNSMNFTKLKFDNVNFSYNKNQPILENINFEINTHEIVGINGKSGTGKSTILKLIMGFYNSISGTILINDNTKLSDYSFNSIYENITLFSQSTYLFKDTIWNNLIIANPSATMEQVVEVTKLVNIYDYIVNTPKGFETQISDLVDNLSTGEKQRLGLARVLLKKPKLLILDEATSNIDALNEATILQALTKLKKEMGILIVSHRLSTLSICDHIYQLDNHHLSKIK